MDTKPKFRFGFTTILFIVVLASQYISTSSMQHDFNEKLQQCHDAANQSTLLLTALINKLQQKNIVNKSEILSEAQTLSADLKEQLQKIEAAQNKNTAEQPSANPQK